MSSREAEMLHTLIYIIGLIVVIAAVVALVL